MPESPTAAASDSDLLLSAQPRRLRLLAISQVDPQSLCHGTALRVHHLLRLLQVRHDISILSTDDVPLTTDSEQASSSRIGSFFRLGPPYPYQAEIHKAVQERIASSDFDAVIVFGAELLHYTHGCRLPIVADLVDHPITFHGITGHGATNFLRAMKRIASLVLYVRRFCGQAKANLVVSEKDARALSRIIGRRTTVVPNGVDTAYFAPRGLPVQEGEIVFSGNMAFRPNVQACEYFAEKVFPQILEAFPKAHWTIAGSNPEPSVERLAEHPSITVTGFVADLRPYIEQAAVIVSPLVSGAGIKNKILEAWAMKKGIVATPHGCAGIDAIDGLNLLVANAPRSFAEKTVHLLRNPADARELGRAGYDTAVKQYSWEDQARKLEQVLLSAVGTRNS